MNVYNWGEYIDDEEVDVVSEFERLTGCDVNYTTFESNENMYSNTHNFTKKVLVVQAKKDLAVPYLYGVRYAVSYKNSTLHIVKEAGHGYDSLENATELYGKVVEFLK